VRGRQKETAGGSRTLSVRLPAIFADRVEAEARARALTTSEYIARALQGRSMPAYPAIAALAEVIALTHHAREQRLAADALTVLDRLVAQLCAAVQHEIGG
jgi:hypothetical protein